MSRARKVELGVEQTIQLFRAIHLSGERKRSDALTGLLYTCDEDPVEYSDICEVLTQSMTSREAVRRLRELCYIREETEAGGSP